MFKKVVLILSALIIFSLPYQQEYAQGAIFSKVASAGAKKAVKEIVKESAFDAAVNIFLDEAYTMALEDRQKYQAQQDYELFCGKKMPDLITCEKPMQAKKVLTAQDKANIGNQAEIELDKLITNGKGFTKWQKFLDWFVPIWVASFALTAITYAMDPEVRSLFNEAGYNALVALGLITPVVSYESIPLKEVELTEGTPITQTNATFARRISTISGTSSSNTIQAVSWSPTNLILETKFIGKEPELELFTHGENLTSNVSGNLYRFDRGTVFTYDSIMGNVSSVTMAKNGVSIETITPTKTADGTYSTFTSTDLQETKYNKQITSIRTRLPYKIGGFYYTDVLYNTTSGDYYDLQIKHDSYNQTGNITLWTSSNTFSYTSSKQVQITAYFNQIPNKKILPPAYGEIETELDLMKQSKYANENGEVALVPPSALPYIQTSTGIQLTPVQDGEEMKFTTPTGESVPEDDITVGEPSIQENPSPSPNTVTPPATQTNPNPEPIPLTPTTPTPTPTPTPPIETEPPKFPEGESCSEGLKLPKLKPLTQTVTTAFPFSIPFDLYKGFQALFSEIGTEKPSFNLVIGDKVDWEITIPDYFDSWKTFSDGILIFVFDVGLIYAIYRFMSGGGS